AEAVQARVLVASIAIGFAALLDVREVHARLRMGPLDDGVQTEVAVLLQVHSGHAVLVIGPDAEPADRIIHAGIVAIVDLAAVRIGDAHQPTLVGAAGHLAVGVLHLGCRREVDRARVRLVLRGQLPQAVVELLYLVDNRRSRGVARAGVPVGTAARSEGGIEPPY